MRNTKSIFVMTLILGILFGASCLIAGENESRSLTLVASSASTLTWTNSYSPIVLHSIGLSVTNAASGTVSVTAVRSGFSYMIDNPTFSSLSNVIIEVDRNWILNVNDTLRVIVAPTSDVQVIVNGDWQ